MLRATAPRSGGGVPPTTEWELSIPENGQRRVIWSGSTEPDAVALSAALPLTLQESHLSELTVQVIRHAPAKSVAKIISMFACQYDRVTMTLKNKTNAKVIDVSKLTLAAANSGKSVCGQVFKKGDLVWTCRNCAKDPTCVQCDPCFRKSSHVGHEVYFHRAGGDSGCCDCGDPEAWSKQGNCTDHSHEHGPDHDPSACLPADLTRGFRAVIQGILSYFATYAVHIVRGFEGLENNNEFMALMSVLLPMEPLVARVHNDDVHTYADVTSAFQRCHFSRQEAERLTEKVDKEGCVIVGTELCSSDKLQHLYKECKGEADLIFSVFPKELLDTEENLLVALKWMLTIGNMSEGFRRIITEEMLQEVGSIAAHNIPLLARSEYEGFQLSRVFLDEGQFPVEVSQVAPIETLRLYFSGRISTPPAQSPSNDEEFKERVRFPFQYCHKNIFSLLCLSSPFLASSLKKWLHDLIMRFQHDLMFKNGFAQVITTLYPTLAVLFCRHYGTAEETIFRLTVQIYTANSVVDLMSTSGIVNRILPEVHGRHVLITNMLANTFYALLCDIGLSTSSNLTQVSAFLNHHSIRKNRVSMICRDFEYVSSDRIFCIQLLSDQVNTGTIAAWLDVCRLVQHIDQFQRMVNHHVEQETDQWQHAANLILEIESVTTHIVSNALLGSAADSSDNEFHKLSAASHADSATDPLLTFQTLQEMRKAAVDNLTRLGLQALQNQYGGYAEQQVVVDIMGSVELSFRKHKVSSDYVSIHIPLHRLILKGLMYAAAGHVSLTDALAMIKALPDVFKRVLVDFPSRCLAFSSQVQCGMWRRNGLAAANLAFNYGRAPLSRTMRDIDVLAIQTGCLTSKADRVLLYVAERFEVLSTLEKMEEPSTSSNVPDTLKEYRPHLLSDYLGIIIQVVTYLPVALINLPEKNEPVEGVDLALTREVFHQILAGNQTISALQKSKIMVGSQRTVTDQMLMDVTQSLCHRRSGAAGDGDGSGNMEENSKLQLKEESYQYFDPEFPNLSNKHSSQVLDRVRDRLKHITSNKSTDNKYGLPAGPQYPDNPYHPLIRLEALPLPHPEFVPVRDVLLHPRFLEIIRRALEFSIRSKNRTDSTGFHRSAIIGRVVHLLTIQLHYARLSNNISELISVYEQDSIGYEVVKILGQVWQQETFKDDLLYHQGLGFVLYQLSALVEIVRELLIGYGFTTAKSSAISAEDEKKRLRKEAQDRALQQAKLRAQQAMAMFGSEMSEDEEEEEENDNGGTMATVDTAVDFQSTVLQKKKKLQQISDACIVCKEKTEQPIGYLCFLQPSTVQKHMLANQSEIAKSLQQVHRVVARSGCDLHGEANEQSTVIHHIPYNEHVVVEARAGSWLKVISPYRGWTTIYTSNPNSSTMLCGSNPAIQYSRQFIRVLHPVSDLLFQKNGGTRVHIATCGHAIHFDCWDMVYSASYSRNLNRGRYAESFAIDVEKGECLCPLCKAITNSIVPIVDLKQAEHSMVDFDQNSDDEEMESSAMTEHKGSFSSSITDLMTLSETTKPFFDLMIPSVRMKRSIRSIRLIDARLHANILQLYPTLSVKEDVRAVSGLKLSELDGLFNEKVKALRMLHASSSTLAYTLSTSSIRQLKLLATPEVSSTANAALEGPDAYVAWSIPVNESNLLRQLLHVIHRTPTLFANSEFLYHCLCVFPMLQLLFGTDDSERKAVNFTIDQTTPQLGKHWKQLLRSLPFHAIHSLDCPDIASILESLQKATAQCGEGYFATELWGFANSPLLTHDLSILVMIFLAIIEDVDAKKACLTVLVSAKIAQILIDPEATRLIDSATSSNGAQKKRMKLPTTSENNNSKQDALVDTLLRLQELLCDKANVPLDTCSDGEHLLLYVADSLLPFLDLLTRVFDLEDLPMQYEHLFHAKKLMQDVGKQDGNLILAMHDLIAALQLPSLTDLLNSPLISLLYGRWASDLTSYYPKNVSSKEVKWFPTESATTRSPSSASKSKGNKRSKARSNSTESEGQDIDHIMSSIEASSSEPRAVDRDLDYFAPDQYAIDNDEIDETQFQDVDDDDAEMQEDFEYMVDGTDMGGGEDEDAEVFHDAVGGEEFDELEGGIGNFEPEFANEEEAEFAEGDELTNNPPRTMEELMQRLRNMTRGNPMVDSILGMFGGSGGDAQVVGSGTNRNNSKTRQAIWKQYGVLPVNVMTDECSDEEYKSIVPFTNHFFVPLQGSVTGTYPIYSIGGALLPYLYPDLSHFNIPFRNLIQNCLIPLPNLYTDLYHKAKFPEGPNGVTIDDPVVCLVCGSVMCAGRRPGEGIESVRNPGECSLHSEQCGAGVGLFFLLHQCQILLIRSNRAIYYPSIYLDATGESCEGSFQNKPMFLSTKRYRKLEEVYVAHHIAKEVARKRASSETVIRQFWH